MSGRASWQGFVLCALPILAAGCDLGPDYNRPDLEVPPAFRATEATAQAAWPSADWWRGFGSPELNDLIAAAEVQNFDIAAAMARIQQADAQVRITGAALLPTVNVSGTASWQHFSGGGSSRTRTVTGTTNGTTFSAGNKGFDVHDYTVNTNAAYMVDFWGKNLSNRQAAVSNAMFSRFDQQTVALTVVTSVASTWFTACAYADRIVVAYHNLHDAEATLAVIQGRLAAGTASALDESQQEALVAGERANIPNLQSQMEQQVIALGILTGRPPEAINVKPRSLDDMSLPVVWPGLPSSLLERRPDVASAEAQLVAATYDVRAARAAFFPSIQLTGSAGFGNTALSTLFGPGGFVASAAASLAQPVFDGGLLRGQLEQAKGRQAELLADYRKAVIQAFTDVDDALTAWRYATEQEALQRKAVATAQRASDIARAQMQAGTVDVTTVLQAETTLFGYEDLLVQVRLVRIQALVNLFKALGGGWTLSSEPIQDQFPGLKPGILPGGVALPVGGNIR